MDAIHEDDTKQLRTISELLLGRFSSEEIAELVGLAYQIGRNRGGLEGAERVASELRFGARA